MQGEQLERTRAQWARPLGRRARRRARRPCACSGSRPSVTRARRRNAANSSRSADRSSRSSSSQASRRLATWSRGSRPAVTAARKASSVIARLFAPAAPADGSAEGRASTVAADGAGAGPPRRARVGAGRFQRRRPAADDARARAGPLRGRTPGRRALRPDLRLAPDPRPADRGAPPGPLGPGRGDRRLAGGDPQPRVARHPGRAGRGGLRRGAGPARRPALGRARGR